jgi:hypothetical protein
MDPSHQRLETVVEELRLSGCHGRAPELATLPTAEGTRLVALRQLEIAAEQAAAAWLDEPADSSGLVRDCFLPRMLGLVEIYERTLPATRVPSSLRRLVEELGLSGTTGATAGPSVCCVLVATMALRQFHEASERDACFAPFSSNIHPDFFARCTRTLGWTPFDASSHSVLSQLVARVEQCKHALQARPVPSTSLAS